MWKGVFSLIVLLLFSGCFEEKRIEEKVGALDRQKAQIEAQLNQARLQANREKELALTKMQEQIEKLALAKSKNEAQKEIELAKIKASQALELQKIEQRYKLQELELKKQKELIELENQKLLAQKELELKERVLYLSLILLLILLIAGLTLFYFYRKRQDKLQAYKDNLEKYFRMKENESKIAIANKIIDTIASGKLSPQQEQRLLGVLNPSMSSNTPLPSHEIKQSQEMIEAVIQEEKDDPKYRK